MRTPRLLIAAVPVTALLLAGCSDSGSEHGNETPGQSASSEQPATEPGQGETPEEPATKGTIVEITINGDNVEPSGARVQAQLGGPIILQIISDREGELHVHSDPEQEIPFGEGTTQAELTIDRPGVVEVEDHQSGLVIVQLEVS